MKAKFPWLGFIVCFSFSEGDILADEDIGIFDDRSLAAVLDVMAAFAGRGKGLAAKFLSPLIGVELRWRRINSVRSFLRSVSATPCMVCLRPARAYITII